MKWCGRMVETKMLLSFDEFGVIRYLKEVLPKKYYVCVFVCQRNSFVMLMLEIVIHD